MAEPTLHTLTERLSFVFPVLTGALVLTSMFLWNDYMVLSLVASLLLLVIGIVVAAVSLVSGRSAPGRREIVPTIGLLLNLFCLIIALMSVLFVSVRDMVESAMPQGGELSDPIVDEDYRFRLEAPSSSWELLDEAAAQDLNRDAQAGAIDETTGIVGMVLVERTNGADLDSLTELIRSTFPGQTTRVTETEHTRFAGLEARQFERSGVISGLTMNFRTIVFVHQDHVYQLFASCHADQYGQTIACGEPFFSAFTLLPGQVRDRAMVSITPDTVGTGWRVREGIFESASYRLAVDPGDQWSLALGFELETMDPAAEVGFTRRNPDVYILVIPEHVATVTPQAYAERVLNIISTNMLQPAGEPPLTRTIDGREVAFHRFFRRDGVAWQYVVGVMSDGDLRIQIMAWAPSFEGLNEHLDDGLSRIRLLSNDELRSLSAEIDSTEDTQRSMGEDWALRGGVYHDYATQLRWRRPHGLWRAFAGDSARRRHPEATLFVSEPSSGVYGKLVVEQLEGVTEDRYHLEVLRAMGLPDEEATTLPRTTRPLASASGIVSNGRVQWDDVPYTFTLTTVLRGRLACHLLLWARWENASAAAEVMAQGAHGLELPEQPMTPTQSRGQVYRDERMGFSFLVPWQGAMPRDITLETSRPMSSVISYEEDQRSVVIFAAASPGRTARERVINDMILQIGRDNITNPFRGSPTESTGTLAGQPSNVMRWTSLFGHTVLHAINVSGTVYGVIISQPPNSTPSSSHIVRGFRLLD